MKRQWAEKFQMKLIVKLISNVSGNLDFLSWNDIPWKQFEKLV